MMKDFLKVAFISLFIIAIIIGLISWVNFNTLKTCNSSTVYATIYEKHQALISGAYVITFCTPTDTISLEVKLREYYHYNVGDKIIVKITEKQGDILEEKYYFYKISEKVEE